MCGLTGIIYFDESKKVSVHELKPMTNIITHRGPDDEGYYINKSVGFGFRRLSIIDLKLGHQPLSNLRDDIWITFNGEIYNFIELRSDLKKKGHKFKTNSDTEVIVCLYEEYGEGCVHFLRGMFAFVIWDERKKLLFGARDRFGIKPLYYYIDKEKFIWGSEMKSLNKARGIKKELNFEALDTYFAYGYTFNSQSIFTQIKKLEPSHYFILKPFEDKKLIFTRYWQLEFNPDYSKTEEYWKNAIKELLQEAVRMRMISDVPLGAFLSGGIDSSSVVSFMSRVSDLPVKTFSIGFKEAKFNELKFANLISKKFGTQHFEMVVEPESIELLPKLVMAFDEPFGDSSAIPTYYISKFARQHVTVVLSGDGGDELFAGYRDYYKMKLLKQNPLNNRFTNQYIFKYLNRLMPDFIYGKGYSYFLSKDKNNIGAYFGDGWKDYEREKLLNKDIQIKIGTNKAENKKINALQFMNCDFLSKMQQLDIQTYLVDDILTKVDRASMLNSLEVRVPILDHKFAELSFQIPSDYKIKGNSKKYILKEVMKEYLPDEILSHKKQGFAIPLSNWFKDDLKEYIGDTLLNSQNKLDSYIQKSYLKKVISFHQKGLRQYHHKIWSILFFNEWLNQNT